MSQDKYDAKLIARIMNALPEVTWDRCTGDEINGSVFGWINRDDGRADFVLLQWSPEWFRSTTSSAEYSLSISERLFGSTTGHRPCRRVEHVYGELVKNKIVVPSAAAG
jgi:hypothetical protein